jgi:cyclopropane fatty-acyl-phospholipid synthase-like methyltransferase
MCIPKKASPPDTNALAEAAYDKVYAEYNKLAENDIWPRKRWVDRLLQHLSPHSAVLDIGCGSGVPADQQIAAQHSLTGVDISQAQIDLARRNVPSGRFFKADLSLLQFPESTFDAVVSFYTIEQVPRRTHAQLFARIATWLKPGGYLLLSVEAADYEDARGTWLGVPIFLSVYKPEQTKEIITQTGFQILDTGIENQFEGDHEVPYLWILAQRGLEYDESGSA